MDNNSMNVVALVSLVISVFTAVVAAVNHKRIRSNCCGKDVVASIDIESTTPSKAPTL
jgi:hypothetical protein